MAFLPTVSDERVVRLADVAVLAVHAVSEPIDDESRVDDVAVEATGDPG